MNPALRMMVKHLHSLAEQGKTYQEAAADIGGTYFYVARLSKKHGIPLRHLKRGRPVIHDTDPRADDMRSLYLEGQTLKQIGQKYGVTRERVRQILTKYFGIRAPDGGRSETARRKRKEFSRKRDARIQRHWGCTYKQYREALQHPDKPTYAFISQRRSAKERGIGWEITFWQWWSIWQQSGKWPERGRGRAYHMCRLNDTGPYAVDNVYIATGVENMQDYWVNRRARAEQSVLEVAQ